MSYTESELSSLLPEIRKPFLAGGNRDKDWDERRNIRFRRALPWLKNSLATMLGMTPGEMVQRFAYRDPLPEYMVRRLSTRLGANELAIKVRGRGDVGPQMAQRLEHIEDWFRGAREELDPLGLIDGRIRYHQAGDSLGFAELEFLPNFVPPQQDEGEREKEYMARVDGKRQDYGLPVCLSAPDPRSMYYAPTDLMRPLAIAAKVINVPLIDIQNKWSAEGFQLKYKQMGRGDGEIITDDYIATGALPTAPTPWEIGKMIRFVLIADKDYIYHLIYPQPITQGMDYDATTRSAGLKLLATYPNPLGKPPFYPIPCSLTSDPDPAFATEALAKEVIDLAPVLNQMQSMRMFRAHVDMLKPWVFQRAEPLATEGSSQMGLPALDPGILEFPPGRIANLPEPDMNDFNRFMGELKEQVSQYDRSLSGAAAAGVIGRSTPAWTVQQFNEEQVGSLTDPLNHRATAWREILLDVAKVCHAQAKEGKIYVTAESRSKKHPELGRVDLKVGLDSSDFEVPFRLFVDIDAMTQSQRSASTEFGRRLRVDGVLSKESYIENYTPIADPVMESRRQDREAIFEPLRNDARTIARELARAKLRAIHGPIIDTILGPPNPVIEQEEDLNNPDANDHDFAPPRAPGLGMSPSIPELATREIGGGRNGSSY